MVIKNINKKGFTAMEFVVAVLIFSGVIALLIISLGSMASDYNNENIINPQFSSKFNNFENSTETASQMWEAATGEEGLSLVGTVEVIFYSTFQVISLVFSSVGEAASQMLGIGEFFGIPSSVTGIFFVLLFAILTVVIIFGILNFVKGSQRL